MISDRNVSAVGRNGIEFADAAHVVEEIRPVLGQKIEPLVLHLRELVYDHLVEIRLLLRSHPVIALGILHVLGNDLPEYRLIVELAAVRDHVVEGGLGRSFRSDRRFPFRLRSTFLGGERLDFLDALGGGIAC